MCRYGIMYTVLYHVDYFRKRFIVHVISCSLTLFRKKMVQANAEIHSTLTESEAGFDELTLVQTPRVKIKGFLFLICTRTKLCTSNLSTILEDQKLESVAEAVRAAYKHISEGENNNGNKFEAVCKKPKWIFFHLPGKRCSLEPTSMVNTSLDRGYDLSSHEMNKAIQQFTVLTGLACLHDLMRNT